MVQLIDTKPLEKELSKMITAFKVLGERAFPSTKVAAGKAAVYIEKTLIDYASGQVIPGTDKTVDNAEYRNSVKRERLDDFNWIIMVTDEKAAGRVEDGSKEIDLKSYLPFPKSRKSKDGSYYSHIPFRHRASSVKKAAGKSSKNLLSLEKSYVTGSYTDEAGIKRYSYKWGKRDASLDKQLKSSKLAGIVRFETSTGGSVSSAYMTFRTISTNSPPESWIIKAKEGVPLTTLASDNTRLEVNRLLKKGIENDLKIL